MELSDLVGPFDHVLHFLPAVEILEVARVSRSVAATALSDEHWRARCDSLWADKAYVPLEFRRAPCLSAYWGSLRDATRCALTPAELCGLTWSTRMKGAAGTEWTDSDPWWNGEEAATRTYSSSSQDCTSGRVTSSLGSGSWRFVPDSSGRSGPLGTFVRHTGSRDFPTFFASRLENWGWVLQNCWSLSTSFPLPLQGECEELEDDGSVCQRVTVRNCRDEMLNFNLGEPLPHEEFFEPAEVDARTHLQRLYLRLQSLQEKMQEEDSDSDDTESEDED